MVQLLKDAILMAATEAGGGDLVAYLTKQAKDNPGQFMALLGKALPLQLTGADGSEGLPSTIVIHVVEAVRTSPDKTGANGTLARLNA